MKVSIIICTYNRATDLRQTLDSIAQVRVPEQMATELLVVDNASTDNTAEVVTSYQMPNMPLRYVHEPRRGKAHAYNTGIREALGEFFLFTDDDLRLPEDWISEMCRPLLSGEADGVAGNVVLAPSLERPWMEHVHRQTLAQTDPIDPAYPLCMVGANMAFPRAVLDRVPCFDTALGPGALGLREETLFSNQLWTAGYKIIYVPQARAVHYFQPERLTRASLLNSSLQFGRSEGYMAYHWEHRFVRAPAVRLARNWVRLALWRRRNAQWIAQTEGAAAEEMYLVRDLNFARQYLIECRKPRFYEKHGLIKKG